MNDDFLYKFRKPPRREFAEALYQRITKPMKTTPRNRNLRFLGVAVAMFAILAGVLFFSPSTRALADNIIRQIGGIIFVQATPQPGSTDNGKEMAGQQATVSPEQQAAIQQTKMAFVADATPQADGGQKANQQNNDQPVLDAGAVSQQVGFTVLAPAYLPDGYTASSAGWKLSSEIPSGDAINRINVKAGLLGVTEGAFINYVNQSAGGILTLEEFKAQPGQSKTVDIPNIEDVTVRGQSGAWISDMGGMSFLAWEENGITYLVVGNPLSQDEALKVAESLGK